MRTDPANWSMVTWRIPADVGVESGCLDVALPEKLVAHGSYGCCFTYHDRQPRGESFHQPEPGTIGDIDARGSRWLGKSRISVLAGSSSPTVPINRWKVRQINPYLETQVSVKGLPEEVLYQESSMPGINTKGRYALISGEWPTKPSEIVVTPSLGKGSVARISSSWSLGTTISLSSEQLGQRSISLLVKFWLALEHGRRGL